MPPPATKHPTLGVAECIIGEYNIAKHALTENANESDLEVLSPKRVRLPAVPTDDASSGSTNVPCNAQDLHTTVNSLRSAPSLSKKSSCDINNIIIPTPSKFWLEDLVEIVRSFINSPSPTPLPPLFSFELNREAAL